MKISVLKIVENNKEEASQEYTLINQECSLFPFWGSEGAQAALRILKRRTKEDWKILLKIRLCCHHNSSGIFGWLVSARSDSALAEHIGRQSCPKHAVETARIPFPSPKFHREVGRHSASVVGAENLGRETSATISSSLRSPRRS